MSAAPQGKGQKGIRLALDAMGGDHAPVAMIQGAIDFAQANPDHHIVLVGRGHDIESCLKAEAKAHKRGLPTTLSIEDAPEVIGMADKITALKEKPNDSMNRCAQLVKAGKADGMVLCGNTGCSVAAAQFHLRRIPGVKRAGILVPLPTPKLHTWICDGGANTVCRPEHLVQFAELSAAYLETACKRPNPKIGVLSIGEEDVKGHELQQSALELLRKTDLNIVGNVEGHDIYTGDIDIVVCDGFTGNVVLKTSEGVLEAVLKILKEEIYSSLQTKIGGRLVRPAFEALKKRGHWSYIGGCPLVGVDGVVIIGHGRSNRLAVFNALRQAATGVETKVVASMRERLKALAAVEAAGAAA
ncbi:phosphate acyltransferase [Planctomycetota bacterium]|nr:phosphate acyltransferase [Planctomycetota bacterium]